MSCITMKYILTTKDILDVMDMVVVMDGVLMASVNYITLLLFPYSEKSHSFIGRTFLPLPSEDSFSKIDYVL